MDRSERSSEGRSVSGEGGERGRNVLEVGEDRGVKLVEEVEELLLLCGAFFDVVGKVGGIDCRRTRHDVGERNVSSDSVSIDAGEKGGLALLVASPVPHSLSDVLRLDTAAGERSVMLPREKRGLAHRKAFHMILRRTSRTATRNPRSSTEGAGAR